LSERRITVLEIDHINQLLPDADEAIEFYQRVYGAEIEADHREVFGPYNNLLVEGDRPENAAIAPEDNLGVLMQFCE